MGEPESEEDNTPTDVSYDVMDWDELPADAKKAAKVLGYELRQENVRCGRRSMGP